MNAYISYLTVTVLFLVLMNLEHGLQVAIILLSEESLRATYYMIVP